MYYLYYSPLSFMLTRNSWVQDLRIWKSVCFNSRSLRIKCCTLKFITSLAAIFVEHDKSVRFLEYSYPIRHVSSAIAIFQIFWETYGNSAPSQQLVVWVSIFMPDHSVAFLKVPVFVSTRTLNHTNVIVLSSPVLAYSF